MFISNKREWNNCFIKNNQEILLDRADFALQEQPENNLKFAISWTWYHASYTMAAQPIKYLELHYTMIKFLIIIQSHEAAGTLSFSIVECGAKFVNGKSLQILVTAKYPL